MFLNCKLDQGFMFSRCEFSFRRLVHFVQGVLGRAALKDVWKITRKFYNVQSAFWEVLQGNRSVWSYLGEAVSSIVLFTCITPSRLLEGWAGLAWREPNLRWTCHSNAMSGRVPTSPWYSIFAQGCGILERSSGVATAPSLTSGLLPVIASPLSASEDKYALEIFPGTGSAFIHLWWASSSSIQWDSNHLL